MLKLMYIMFTYGDTYVEKQTSSNWQDAVHICVLFCKKVHLVKSDPSCADVCAFLLMLMRAKRVINSSLKNCNMIFWFVHISFISHSLYTRKQTRITLLLYLDIRSMGIIAKEIIIFSVTLFVCLLATLLKKVRAKCNEMLWTGLRR